MKIINLTPHTLNIFDENDNTVLSVAPSGRIARIVTEKTQIGTIDDIPIYQTLVTGEPALIVSETKESVEFPSQNNGVIYVVSGLFRQYFARDDVYQPGELKRDENGNPVGCVGLSR